MGLAYYLVQKENWTFGLTTVTVLNLESRRNASENWKPGNLTLTLTHTMFLITAILNGQDLEASITHAKIAYKNRQLAYQWLKKGLLKSYVPKEGQQKEKLHDQANKTLKTRGPILHLMQPERLDETNTD